MRRARRRPAALRPGLRRARRLGRRLRGARALSRRVAVLSTGVPDPTQGGSGIFNFFVSRDLVARGWEATAFFRTNERFLRELSNPAFLAELQRDGLRVELVPEDDEDPGEPAGADFLLASSQYAVCRRLVENRRAELEALDGIVALDLAWAVALRDVEVPVVCLLGDPVSHRLAWDTGFRATRPTTWRRARAIRRLRPAYFELLRRLERFRRPGSTLGAFAAHEARELQDEGIPARHFRTFAPGPTRPRRRPRAPGLRVVHVGSLHTTATRSMLRYWERELLPALGSLELPIELRFVGRLEREPALARLPRNVTVRFLGYLDSVEEELALADVFLTPMRYPVGVRTRAVGALAHACPVLADPTAALGLPELQSGREILYAGTGAEVARELGRLAADREFADELGRNGRRAWERLFRPEPNAREIVDALGL